MHESRNVVNFFFEQWYQPVATTGAIGPPGPSTCVGRPQACACPASGCGCSSPRALRGPCCIEWVVFFCCLLSLPDPDLETSMRFHSIAASHSPEFSLMHVDVSCAYFHAKAQRPVLGKLPAEDCSGKDQGKIGLLTKSMYGTRDAASNWERDWQGHLENWDHVLGRSARSLYHNKKEVSHTETTSWWEDRRRVCWSSRSSWRACIQSKRASPGQVRSAKSIKALSRRICWERLGYCTNMTLNRLVFSLRVSGSRIGTQGKPEKLTM